MRAKQRGKVCHTPMLTTLCLLAAGVLALGRAEAAAEGPYRMEILVGDRLLPEYTHRGKTYVEAEEGREYAVRLSNLSGERVAVALAVDGLNSIDARHTSAGEARKWVLRPYETIVVSGWQISASTARRFFFTTEERSYGAWLGKTRDLGNISAAFFRERPRALLSRGAPGWEGGRFGRERKDALDDLAGPSAEPRRSKAAAHGESGIGGALKMRRSAGAPAAPAAEAAEGPAATGIGRRQAHPVEEVAFEIEESPRALITLRYEYREALVELGVFPRLPSALRRRETSRGFVDEGFAPDPARGW